MKEKLYSPWKSKMKAQKNEESKFQRALKPFPNQSSMQGRESEKESNIQQFRMLAKCPRGVQVAGQRARLQRMNFVPLQNFRKPCKILKNEFRTLTKFSQALRNCEE